MHAVGAPRAKDTYKKLTQWSIPQLGPDLTGIVFSYTVHDAKYTTDLPIKNLVCHSSNKTLEESMQQYDLRSLIVIGSDPHASLYDYDRPFMELHRLKNLNTLAMHNTGSSECVFGMISMLPKLRELSFSDNKHITGIGLYMHVSSMQSLTRLDLTGLPNLNDDVMIAVATLQNLNQLSTINTPLGHRAWEYFTMHGHPPLKRLAIQLSNGTGVGTTSDCLAKITTLVILVMWHGRLTIRDARNLSTLRLQMLEINHTKINNNAFATMVKNMPLNNLGLYACRLTPTAFAFVPDVKVLKVFFRKKTDFGQCAKKLIKRKHTNLKKLVIEGKKEHIAGLLEHGHDLLMNLETLCIIDCDPFMNDIIVNYIMKYPHLIIKQTCE
jgi:hypothetical protein